MNYFAHQGIDHGSTLEAALHITTTSILFIIIVAIMIATAIFLVRRFNKMQTVRIDIKKKEQ